MAADVNQNLWTGISAFAAAIVTTIGAVLLGRRQHKQAEKAAERTTGELAQNHLNNSQLRFNDQLLRRVVSLEESCERCEKENALCREEKFELLAQVADLSRKIHRDC